MSQATVGFVFSLYFNFIYPFVDFLKYSGITSNHPTFGLNRPVLCNEKIYVVVAFFLDFTYEQYQT